jgi:hypothetical protein
MRLGSHLEPLCNPFQRDRRFTSQPLRNRHFPGIPFAPRRQRLLIPPPTLQFLGHDSLGLGLRRFMHGFTVMAGSAGTRLLPPRSAVAPAPAAIGVVRRRCPGQRDIRPATGPPAATQAVCLDSSGTPARCSIGIRTRAVPAGAIWPAPGSSERHRTPSANSRCHCRPRSRPCNDD